MDYKETRAIFPIEAMGKPRMTQRDKWAKRPAVTRYRRYADQLRLAATAKGLLRPAEKGWIPYGLKWTAGFPMPQSWSKKKMADTIGRHHESKPDRDNIDKGLCDIFFKNDAGIALGQQLKVWVWPGEPELEITILWKKGT